MQRPFRLFYNNNESRNSSVEGNEKNIVNWNKTLVTGRAHDEFITCNLHNVNDGWAGATVRIGLLVSAFPRLFSHVTTKLGQCEGEKGGQRKILLHWYMILRIFVVMTVMKLRRHVYTGLRVVTAQFTFIDYLILSWCLRVVSCWWSSPNFQLP